jgi:hypothetical protein
MNPDWTIAAVAVSTAVLLIAIWVNFLKPYIRSLRMRRPFYAYFKGDRTADSKELTELTVPAQSEVVVNFRFHPRLSYVEHFFLFDLRGDDRTKPHPVSVLNEYVIEGALREQGPTMNENHFINYNHCYCIKGENHRIGGNVYAIGFKLKTQWSGKFDVHFELITDEGPAECANQLTLTVS